MKLKNYTKVYIDKETGEYLLGSNLPTKETLSKIHYQDTESNVWEFNKAPTDVAFLSVYEYTGKEYVMLEPLSIEYAKDSVKITLSQSTVGMVCIVYSNGYDTA